jgi:hypothetical protein
VTFNGTGFPSSSYPGTDLQVKVGDSIATIISYSPTQITIQTVAKTTGVDITVSVNGQTATSSTFNYDLTATPSVTSYSPVWGSPIVTTILTFVGEGFAASGNEIKIGDEDCLITNVQLDSPNTEDTIICNLLGGPKGDYVVKLTVPDKGYATIAG